MSQSAAILGKGTTLGYGADGGTAPGSYTLVAELISGSIPKRKVAQDDVTHMTSTSNYREKVFGDIDPGEVSLSVNYTTASNAILEPMIGAMHWWELTLPDTHTYVCRGAITDYEGNVEIDKKIAIKFNITLTGPITYA